MGNRAKSDFLVSSPSFLSGTSRLLDWYGLFDDYNISRNSAEADAKAIASDWNLVGNDICDAMAEFEVYEAQ